MPASYRFEAIGTQWQIDTPTALDPALTAQVAALVEEYDAVYSRFRTDSLVSRIAREPGQYTLPASAEELCRVYTALYSCTDGAMTPLLGRSLEHLGYDAGYSLHAGTGTRPAPAWDESVRWNGRDLHTTEPVLLDVGAAGKGQLVDLVAALLNEHHEEYLLDAGSDLRHRGPEPVQIGLEHPYDPSRAIGMIELDNHALCASAANRRAWGDGLHHLLDGRTGAPVEAVVATWVLAADALTADALATALFLVGPQALRPRFSFDYVRVFSDGHAEYSAEFEGKLFN